MRKFKFIIPLFSLLIISCSSDDNDSSSSSYAMTAKINGATFEGNSAQGNNMFSSYNVLGAFPVEDFVLLQGRQGGAFGNPEIDIWLKRTDIAIGTYNFNYYNNATTSSHYIDLIDNSNSEYEETISGSITITEVNTSSKTVKGTFEFTTSDDPQATSPIVNFEVTNGTFNYKYED